MESGTGQPGSGQGGAARPEAFAGFGANEWLVYEMYQQYLKDPESVDKAWWDFFADYQPSDSHSTPSTSTNGPTTTKSDSTPKSASDSTTAGCGPAPSKDKDAEKGSTKPAEVATPAAGGSAGRGSGVGTNGASEDAEPSTAAFGGGGRGAQPQSDAPSRTPLRGAAARVVANMEASLAVPTATSVATSRRSC